MSVRTTEFLKYEAGCKAEVLAENICVFSQKNLFPMFVPREGFTHQVMIFITSQRLAVSLLAVHIYST
jgi:hypothetical protein